MFHEIHLGQAIFAGFVAGYIKTLAGYWIEGVFGLPKVDSAAAGMKYLGGDKPGWWWAGIIFHFFNSILFTLAYAWWFYPRADWIAAPWLRGVVWGILIMIVIPIILLGTIGALSRQRMTGGVKQKVSLLIVYVIWGFVVGILYMP